MPILKNGLPTEKQPDQMKLFYLYLIPNVYLSIHIVILFSSSIYY